MQEFLHGTGAFLLYILLAAGTAMTARILVKIPDELFRKILHFILLGAYIPLTTAFDTWWMASGLAAVLIVVFYGVLTLAERLSVFAAFLNERKQGEIKNSMILALTMMVLSTAVCWGLFGDRYLVVACVYAWGVGDAFAALVGKRFGKRKFRLKFADPGKSVAGSAAMFVTSAAAVWLVLLLRGGIGAAGCGIIAIAAATVSAFVEMCTRNGYDTFTCPAAAMVVILPLCKVLGGG